MQETYNSIEDAKKAVTELIYKTGVEYIGTFKSIPEAEEHYLAKEDNGRLDSLISSIIKSEIDNGKIREIAERHIEDMLNKAFDEALCGYSGTTCYKYLSEELKKTMNSVIESYNFSNYLVKITEKEGDTKQ